MTMLELQCVHALERAQVAIEGRVPITALNNEIGTLARLLNIERNNGSATNREAATRLLANLDAARENLRRLWAHPTDSELAAQVAMLSAKVAEHDLYLSTTWPDCRSQSIEEEARLYRRALAYRNKQLHERAHSLQAI